jgi:CMP-2-keto-3-deoxyoctulosonic acid synthetase
MMRVLENGITIKMVYIQEDNFSVDTREDLENVIELMKKDELVKSYIK